MRLICIVVNLTIRVVNLVRRVTSMLRIITPFLVVLISCRLLVVGCNLYPRAKEIPTYPKKTVVVVISSTRVSFVAS